MKCKRCGSDDIREYRSDVINVGEEPSLTVYAACHDCGLHADLDELLDETYDFVDDLWEELNKE